MPAQDFVLDPARQVNVFWNGDDWENFTVRVDRSIIGTVPHAEELIKGQEFALPDGTVLKVQLVNDDLRVLGNGKSLSPAPIVTHHQQPGYGYGVSPVQAVPLSLGEAMRQLPKQYIKVLTKPSTATFAEEQGKASWSSVWVQLICYALVGAVLIYLADVISQTGSSGLNLATFFIVAVVAIVVIPIGSFIAVGIYYLIAKAFGGQGTFLAQIYTTLLYSVPLGILVALLGLIPDLGKIANIVSGGYEILLSVFMIMGVHRLSGGKATAVVLIPVAVIVFIVVLIAIAIVAARPTWL